MREFALLVEVPCRVSGAAHGEGEPKSGAATKSGPVCHACYFENEVSPLRAVAPQCPSAPSDAADVEAYYRIPYEARTLRADWGFRPCSE